MLLLGDEGAGHQGSLQSRTEGIAPGRPRRKGPRPVGQLAPLDRDIGQAGLRDLEGLGVLQVRSQTDLETSVLRKAHGLQEFVAAHPEPKDRITCRGLQAVAMVIGIHRGEEFWKIAIFPQPLLDILVILHIGLLEFEVHRHSAQHWPQDSKTLDKGLVTLTPTGVRLAATTTLFVEVEEAPTPDVSHCEGA